jgi:MoaA/NifB/PqqE/SkfB family radical SAM enzyme
VNDLEALLGIQHLCSVSPHLEVDFSSKCNLRCPMCHQSKMNMGSFQLNEHEINTLIDSLPERDSVVIAGLGEPLLYPALDTFLVRTAQYRCHTHLFTNGQLIHRKINVLRQVDRISVSVDGATAATFETLRRGAKFGTVCRNIELLRKAAPQTVLVTSTVVSRVNLGEVAAIIMLAESLGMDEVHLSPVDHTEALALQPQNWTVFVRQLERVQAGRIKIINNLHPRHFVANRNSQVSEVDRQLVRHLAAPLPPVKTLSRPIRKLPTQGTHIQNLPAVTQLEELERRIIMLATRRKALIDRLPQVQLGLPYCSAPWKYGFAQSNGLARLCPYADIAVGTVSEVLGGKYNSSLLEHVRASMRDQAIMLSVCQGCTDDHRQFRRNTMQHTLAGCLAPAHYLDH